MGKKKKAHRNNRRKQQRRKDEPLDFAEADSVWTDDGEVHAFLPGEEPPAGFFELLTHYFQRELRNSPLWEEMVREFGEREAAKQLKECRGKSGKKTQKPIEASDVRASSNKWIERLRMLL